MRERCFHAEGGRWRIADRYRLGVGFQYHNLVKHHEPSWWSGLGLFDLILCRNVMIYFDRPTAARVVEGLHESLRPGAWLIVGHADHDPDTFRGFDVVSQDGVSIYRKRGGPAAVGPILPKAAEGALMQLPAERGLEGCPPPGEAPLAAADPGCFRAVSGASISEPVMPDRADSSQQMLGDVRALADAGASIQAETLCSALIEKSPLDPAPHFYQALILEQLGRCDEAERSLRRVLYLDRRFVLAHYHLGLLLQRSGRPPAARQYFENALDLLAGLHDGHVFEHGDSIRAADLRVLAEMNLEGL
jgi:chemotaxis protein methyltransferase CheR